MDTPQVLLEHHLKTLRLPTFLREYDKVAQQCAAEGVDFPRYLLRLSELELLDRERRATERRIRQAKFDVVKSQCGFRRRRTLIPKGTRTAFRAEGEQCSERSDAGTSIVQEVFAFVKENYPERSVGRDR